MRQSDNDRKFKLCANPRQESAGIFLLNGFSLQGSMEENDLRNKLRTSLSKQEYYDLRRDKIRSRADEVRLCEKTLPISLGCAEKVSEGTWRVLRDSMPEIYKL